MTTDGPVVLLELAHQLHEDWPRVARALRNLADAWEAERAQAAADRAALATAQHANDAERGEWSEYYALLTGDRGAWSQDDMRSAIKAQANALAQARALLTELYDDSPCRFDHHGHCQEHNSMTDVCIMRRIAAALSDGAR